MTTVETGRWYTEEINALIKIWGDATVQNMFDGTVRDAEVYKLISKKLSNQGFNRSVNQVKTKLKSLKREYRKTIDELNASKSGGKIKFVHFDTMNKVLGENVECQPVFNNESSLPNDEINSCENSIVDEVRNSIVDEMRNNFVDEMENSLINEIKKEISPSHSESEDASLPNEVEAPRTFTVEVPKEAGEKPKREKKASIKQFITSISSAVDKFISIEKQIEEKNFQQNKKFQEELLKIEREKLNLLKRYIEEK